eukprot:6468251-Amphidinium_carterae.2
MYSSIFGTPSCSMNCCVHLGLPPTWRPTIFHRGRNSSFLPALATHFTDISHHWIMDHTGTHTDDRVEENIAKAKLATSTSQHLSGHYPTIP